MSTPVNNSLRMRVHCISRHYSTHTVAPDLPVREEVSEHTVLPTSDQSLHQLMATARLCRAMGRPLDQVATQAVSAHPAQPRLYGT